MENQQWEIDSGNWWSKIGNKKPKFLQEKFLAINSNKIFKINFEF